MIQVQFQPTGKRVGMPAGSDLLEAARSAGIEITSVCGGKGTCGQCQVIVLKGQVSPPIETEERILSRVELISGRRLACCTRALGDVVVEVPKSSLLAGQRLQIESELGSEMDGEVAGPPADPPVRAVPLALEKPSLQDPRSDLSRVFDGIRAAHRGDHPESEADLPALHASPAVIRSLPELLRENNWRVTAFLRGDELVGLGQHGERPLGFCVDLGTTKIAASLVDLQTGQLIASGGAPNPQMGYGEDVISRLNYAQRSPDGSQVLAEKVRGTLNSLLGELTAQAGVPRGQVAEACIVGNTAMVHLLLRLPVRQLAMAPYVAAASEAQNVRAAEIGLEMAPGAYAYIPPCVGGFVGADHIAMILACGLDHSEKVALGVDIGTNTEIAIRKPGMSYLSSASCASGPAFEGAHIGEGMRAASGAIEKVRITEDGAELVTIQGEPPVGLCGSGIIDTVAELHRCGLLNRQGLLSRGDPRIRQGKNGGEFLLARAEVSGTGRDIALDQKDINEVQLAKGAIHAGLQILLNATQTAPEDVEEVIIAGAFGSYLNIEHAIAIGLFPRLPRARFRQVGNAALVGACQLLLSRQARERAQAIQRATDYLELTTYPRFNRIFALAMLFPDREENP